MPIFFASSWFIASEYVLFAFDGFSHTRPFAASSSFTFAYVSAGDSRSLILLYVISDVPVYSQYTSIWPLSCACRSTALPIPALTSGLNPLACRSCAVICDMICCSVKFLPPTTIVCASTLVTVVESTALARNANIRFSFIGHPPLIAFPATNDESPQRIDTARNHPEREYAHQEIHQHRQQRRRQGASQHHARFVPVSY